MPDAPRLLSNDKLNADLEITLRDGLRRLPGPTVSADFDARVLAALAVPPSPWEALRLSVVSALRPLLCGAACSLTVTLLALFWTLHAPVAAPASFDAPRAVRPLDMAAVDHLLSQPNLRASSLAAWAQMPTASSVTLGPPPVPADTKRRRGAGHRRASRPFPTLLTA